jgi:hypothetical protein
MKILIFTFINAIMISYLFAKNKVIPEGANYILVEGSDKIYLVSSLILETSSGSVISITALVLMLLLIFSSFILLITET